MFKFNVKDVAIVQLTNFKSGTVEGNKESDKKSKETYLTKQQSELFEYIRDRQDRKDWSDKRAEERKDFFPKEYYYGTKMINNQAACPDGSFVTFVSSDFPKNVPTKVEHHINADGFTNNVSARSKVSVKNLGENKLGIYHVAKDTFFFIDPSALSGIKNQPEYYKEYPSLVEKEPQPKAVQFGQPVFNKQGTIAIVEVRSQDNKDRWIVRMLPETGAIIELNHQHDTAWINGPGIGYGFGVLGFLQDDETIYFQSEVTGYSHLYTLNVTTGAKSALTSGKWEVRGVKLSNDGKTFFLHTNTRHPGNREFYTLDIASRQMTGILVGDGAHEVVLSPDEKSLLVRYSYKNKPWDLYIAENKTNTIIRPITKSTKEAFDNYPWIAPEVINFKAKDGQNVYARIYQPKAKIKNGAAVIFVHGAGYLQNAHNHWSSYMREYMFHNLLTDKGYTVLDIDYRGSDGYGRDVRTGIYRYMGGLDLSDHIDGKNHLVSKYNIDPKRVGMYGGSYGGFITLMALLTEPGTFKAGAALRSVTDWAHYNHGYTSNILNFPETDSIAYRRSSPIYFAENLQDKLVMLHGMVDDNVQFQDVVRLSQRFIELGK
ncbi:MAG: prolyl oligopeptidase family serine peptidase, partial [Saprospiraceae bacterium]